MPKTLVNTLEQGFLRGEQLTNEAAEGCLSFESREVRSLTLLLTSNSSAISHYQIPTELIELFKNAICLQNITEMSKLEYRYSIHHYKTSY